MLKWLIVALTCLSLTSCVAYVRPAQTDLVWQEGYWNWSGTAYYWVPGRYVGRGVWVHPHHHYHPGTRHRHR